jgi:hypothetical protein
LPINPGSATRRITAPRSNWQIAAPWAASFLAPDDHELARRALRKLDGVICATLRGGAQNAAVSVQAKFARQRPSQPLVDAQDCDKNAAIHRNQSVIGASAGRDGLGRDPQAALLSRYDRCGHASRTSNVRCACRRCRNYVSLPGPPERCKYIAAEFNRARSQRP